MRNSIALKFIAAAIASILCLTLFALLVLLPQLRNDYLKERQDATRHLTELALSQIAELHNRAAAGGMTPEAAQAAAVRIINTARYGHNGYLWLLDAQGTMLANPATPQYVGNNMADFKDSRGQQIFQQVQAMAQKSGAGFITYAWPKPGEQAPSAKLSFFESYKPWGWIIGTGVYVDEVDQMIASLRHRVVLAALLLTLLAAGAISLSFKRFVTAPLGRVSDSMEAIAAGKGDLTMRLAPGTGDEIGRLAAAFNCFADEIQQTILNVTGTLDQVTEFSFSTQQVALSIRNAAGSQFISIDEASIAVSKLEAAIKAIVEDTKTLQEKAQGAARVISQSTGSITEITATSASLDTAADTIQGAVNQIASSLKQVTANLVVLAQLTESATKSAANINRAIKDISATTREQADIARDVQLAASTAGLGLVNDTRQGMERIRHEVFTTNQAIESLSAKSGDIGRIVSLIGDIAEETNLLALNAAILAAQAGPHGKAFAVVAEKVRALARRSTASTKDIAEIIGQVQEEIILAGKAVKQSIGEVDRGMVCSTDAESALQEIAAKTERSLEMALQVEASITLQSKNIELNASAVDNFRKMSQDIKLGVDKQSKAADAILNSVKELRCVSSQMKHALGEQTEESEQTATIIALLLEHANLTFQNTLDQEQLAEQMVVLFQALMSQIEQHTDLSAELEGATTGLAGQAGLLRDKLASFRIE